MRRTCARSSGASETTCWCERMPQGARNSGRVVATTSSGACAPRSASDWMRSRDVGSAQCRSSKASTAGCVRAPARYRPSSRQVAAYAILRARSSARSAGSGISTSGASSVAFPGVELYQPSVLEVGETPLGGASAPPKRARPHSATGCRGVFCRSCDAFHSTQVCGVSASLAWNSSIETRLAEAGLAYDQHELAFARARALPAAR